MNRRVALPLGDLATVGSGAVLALAATMFVARYGSTIGLGAMLGATLFLAMVAAFAFTPHVAVAVVIPYLLILPTLRIFVTPLLGATKDLITIAAICAATMVFLRRRAARRPPRVDRIVMILIAFLFGLYLLNIGGNISGESGYGAAWFHGVRLFAEPLALLLVGASLGQPERTYRWASIAFVSSTVATAFVGIFQQFVGKWTLVGWGYSFEVEIRTIAGGHLRSFGTLPEPFSYAAILMLGTAVLLLTRPVGRTAVGALAVVAIGAFFSYERTAAVIMLALIGLAIAQRGKIWLAVVFILAAAAAAAVFFVASSDVTSTRSVPVSPNEYLTLNGRTNVWRRELGHSSAAWVFGRGVGAAGTASQRASESLVGVKKTSTPTKTGSVVDSGYLAAAADIGFVGVAFLLALLGRLFFLAWGAAERGAASGWIALGLLTVLALDALTRESFTAFPTAYVGMLFVGLVSGTQSAARPGASAALSRTDAAY